MAFCSRGVRSHSKNKTLLKNLRSSFVLFSSLILLSFSVRAIPLKTQHSQEPLVVYIHETLYVTQKDTLEKQCDFPFVLKPFSGGDLVGKILLEGERLKADVVVGIEGERMNDPAMASLAKPLPRTLFEKLSLPFAWKNKQFLPLSYAYLAFLYEAGRLQPVRETLAEFLKSLPPKSLVVPDPRTSMVGRGALSWVMPSDYTMLHKKTLTYPKGWSGAFALFNKGRAKVMLSYSTSVIYHHGNKQPFVRWVSFKKTPHPLQVMTAFVNAKKALHPKAFVFLETLLSKSSQQGVIDNYAYPVIDIPIPDAYEKCRPQESFLLEGGAAKEADNLKQWMSAGYQK